MPGFDAVLFDLDGTLLYTLPDIAESLNRALESRGYPAHGLEAVRGFVGNGAARLVARRCPAGQTTRDYAAVRQAYDRIYAAHACDRTQPYPGVPELLGGAETPGDPDGGGDQQGRLRRRAHDPAVLPRYGGRRPGQAGGLPHQARPGGGSGRAGGAGLPAGPGSAGGDSSVDRETARNAGLACVLVAWGTRT